MLKKTLVLVSFLGVLLSPAFGQAKQDEQQTAASKKARGLRRVFLGGIAILLIGGGALWDFQKKEQAKTAKAKVLFDPTIDKLWAYAKKYNTNRVPFTLPTDDGREFQCIGALEKPGIDPEIDYIGTGVKCKRWRNRYNVAKSIPHHKE